MNVHPRVLRDLAHRKGTGCVTSYMFAARTLAPGRTPGSEGETLIRAARPVLIVAVGGVDPTGGAGVVRDLLTAREWGARVRLVPTAWTEQSASRGVSSVERRDPAALGRALGTALAEARAAAANEGIPAAVKIGMLPDATAVRAVVDALTS